MTTLERIEHEYFYALQRYKKQNAQGRESNFLKIELKRVGDKIEQLQVEKKKTYDRVRLQERIRFNSFPDTGITDEQFYHHVGYFAQIEENKLADEINRLELEHAFYRTLLERIETKDKQSESDLLDLSNSKGTEKIIFLHKSGVLDFLKKQEPFNTSNNQLAILLSAITGEKADTLVSYINPIYGGVDTVQKNNPLANEKKVEKVVGILASMGFKAK